MIYDDTIRYNTTTDMTCTINETATLDLLAYLPAMFVLRSCYVGLSAAIYWDAACGSLLWAVLIFA
jgi:hypothetical protein